MASRAAVRAGLANIREIQPKVRKDKFYFVV